MEQEEKVLMPLNIQLFADGGEDAGNVEANSNSVEKEEKNTENNEKSKTMSKKKYSDEEVNAISKKNEEKALKRQLAELGIDDIEDAKATLAEAKRQREASKSDEEKNNEIKQERDKYLLESFNSKIENALLRKGVSDEKVERAIRLIDKTNIVDEKGYIDPNKLATEVEEVLKVFPELINKKVNENIGFTIGGDGRDDKDANSLEDFEKVMGIKN